MKEVKRYKCGYCKRVRAKKKDIHNHEKICFYNPDTKSCVTCINRYDKPLPEGGKITMCGIYEKEIFVKKTAIRNCCQWEYENFLDCEEFLGE